VLQGTHACACAAAATVFGAHGVHACSSAPDAVPATHPSYAHANAGSAASNARVAKPATAAHAVQLKKRAPSESVHEDSAACAHVAFKPAHGDAHPAPAPAPVRTNGATHANSHTVGSAALRHTTACATAAHSTTRFGAAARDSARLAFAGAAWQP
jgi:hypothetical protein